MSNIREYLRVGEDRYGGLVEQALTITQAQ